MVRKITAFVLCVCLFSFLAIPVFAAPVELPPLPDIDTQYVYVVRFTNNIEAFYCDNPAYFDHTIYHMMDYIYRYRLVDNEWVLKFEDGSLQVLTANILYDNTKTLTDNSGVVFPAMPISCDDWDTVKSKFIDQVNVKTVVSVLALGASAVVGLVFMWWGVCKLTRALIKSFKKGKVSM